MATNHGSEERRRRILERGSDRMALITGRIKTLPTSPPPSQSIISSSSDPPHQHHHHVDNGSNHHHLRAGAVVKDYSSDDTLLNKESTDEDSSGNKFGIGSPGEPQLNKGSTSIEAQEIQTTLDNGVKTIVQKTSAERDQQLPKPRRRQPRLFTSKRIHSCIVASENTRVTCSLIIAFLVVFSYVDYPLFGRNIVNSKSVVASRPLYILLLTDVTIVFARVYLEKRREFDEAEEERVALQEDGQNWEKAEKVLERGLVAYQAIRAIFIDCSVYAVVVICGLSLL
ncbi:uncharacterized protein LOC121247832 [Juglans microcarpa x Juglans regia]|uniref:uncharacterized protein LOC121247832 n=1 Tax=Juglans microcarpa x Juglans regia TaxID=2249226 RepID=UPI001B7F5C85|nr:uncharacterized protein LOC121247832 [Juglans microcarpa x Juglans regia]